MTGKFRNWIVEQANAQNMSLDDVRDWARILPRRWNLLMNGFEPTDEEAEAIATEALDLFPAEAYGKSDASIATAFRRFLGMQEPREVYKFHRLWPILQSNFGYRIMEVVPEVIRETFEEVLNEDNDDLVWPPDDIEDVTY